MGFNTVNSVLPSNDIHPESRLLNQGCGKINKCWFVITMIADTSSWELFSACLRHSTVYLDIPSYLPSFIK